MSTKITIEDWVKQDVARLLASIDQCAPDFDEATQLRFVRLLVEQGLDELEADDNDYYDFLFQCAILASENMQDARLQVLEHRVDDLENPPFSLAQTLLEGALIMVGEVIIATSAYYAIPALMAVLSSRKLTRTAHGILGQIPTFDGDIKKNLAIELRILENVLETQKAFKAIDAAGLNRWGDQLPLYEKIDAIRRDSAMLRSQLKASRLALEYGKKEAAQRAIEAYESAAASIKLKSTRLDEFLNGVLGNTVIGRIGETAGQDLSAISMKLFSASDPSVFLPFQTSGIVGELISAIQDLRRTSRQNWGDLRLQIRTIDDTKFLESETVRSLQALASAARYQPGKVSTLTSEERNAFILGFEALLWKHWFIYSNLLYLVPFAERDPERWHQVGEVFEGRLVKSQDLGDLNDGQGYGFVIGGDHYPGAQSLNEDLAKILFNKFAKDYFVSNPGEVPAPMLAINVQGDFDVARYHEAWRMSKTDFIGGENSARARLVDEVRVLVIVYFMRTARDKQAEQDAGGAADSIRNIIREIIGLPENQPLDPFPSLPTFEAPGAPAISHSTDALQRLSKALATTTGVEETWRVGDARVLLETAVGRLEAQIAVYPLLYPASAASTVVANDAVRAIETTQEEVKARQASFLELAAEQQELVTEVETQLGERVRNSTGWSPDQIPEGTWHWYPPEENTSPIS